ncbi:MAG: DUF58 domain-containing protein [Endomicrobium sp.]|jgi:uncharacterized protein (DUF58 family)|nr:DUF58 domain-containing protein [Endomicrobium sp.]
MPYRDILKKQIRQLEIKSNKLVNEIFAGRYQSVFKGQGIEFAEVREYQIGDDFRIIDRNVTARYGKPYIKLFSEERELTIIFLIDVSLSQRTGSSDKLKSEVAAEVAAILAFSSLKNNDRIGMLTFTDRIEKVITPRKGKNNILRIIDEILTAKPLGVKTSILKVLKSINKIWRRKAVVFLISDFLDNNYEKDLIVTAKRHDLICINIEDKIENNLPEVGLVEMQDPETNRTVVLDTFTESKLFKLKSKVFKEERDIVFKRAQVDVINLNTNESYIKPLVKFFKKRRISTRLG